MKNRFVFLFEKTAGVLAHMVCTVTRNRVVMLYKESLFSKISYLKFLNDFLLLPFSVFFKIKRSNVLHSLHAITPNNLD